MIKALLDATKDIISEALDDAGIEYVITVFPTDVEVPDDNKLYVYVDIAERTFSRFSTMDYVVKYDIKVGLAKQVQSYGDYIDAIDGIEKVLIDKMMARQLVSEVRTQDYTYDSTNSVGFSSIIFSIGVS